MRPSDPGISHLRYLSDSNMKPLLTLTTPEQEWYKEICRWMSGTHQSESILAVNNHVVNVNECQPTLRHENRFLSQISYDILHDYFRPWKVIQLKINFSSQIFQTQQPMESFIQTKCFSTHTINGNVERKEKTTSMENYLTIMSAWTVILLLFLSVYLQHFNSWKLNCG